MLRPLALVCALALPCSISFAQPEDIVQLSDEDHLSTQDALRDQLQADDASPLRAFYEARDFKPVWTGSDAADEHASSVKAALEHADREGLKPKDYLIELSQWSEPPQGERDAAAYDLGLTQALLRYASDVHSGRLLPNDVFKDVAMPLGEFDPLAALADALKQDDIDTFLSSLPPSHPAYRRLANALAQYRVIDAMGGWPRISGKSKMKLLAERLAFEDATLAATPAPSESDIRIAILRFQRRNGLKDDGKIGPEMLKALNTSAAYRIKQITANMERWRWVPRAFERRYVLVNVPDQSLIFVRDRKVVLTSRVIIGRKTSPTPILRTEVLTVVANPPWDIPDDIAAKQILPHLRKSPNYLSTRNMVLANAPAGTNVNWQRVAANDLPYQIQQNPGPGNVLGVLMLDSPNDFDVYMHDTSNRAMFNLDLRTLSNGCVRVDEIFSLASLALTGTTAGAAEELVQSVGSGETQRLSLPKPLPVYMLYWTAMARSDGTVDFRPDLYDRDRALIARLQAKPH